MASSVSSTSSSTGITTSSTGTSSTRVTGMVSGLDTDTIVKQLTTNDQNKITVAQQQKQTLEWKRDQYRAITTKLADFQTKYYGTTNNILSSSYFDQLKVTNSASQYVSVTSGTNASTSNVIISDIVSLASSSKLESASTVSKATTITVDLTSSPNLSGKSINVNLDGTVKTLTFSDKDYSTVNAVKDELQSMIDTAFGQNRVNISVSDKTLTFDSGSSTLTLDKSGITGSEASDILSFNAGVSNKISLDSSLSSVNLAQPVGSGISFKINDVLFSFSSDKTMRNVMDKINSSNAGVKVSYSTLTDKFTIVSKQTGAGVGIKTSDESGTLLNSMFGTGNFTDGTNAEIKINTNVSSPDPAMNTYTTVIRNSNTFDIDGTTYTLLGKTSGDTQENININLSVDVDSMVTKIKDFIASYNDILSTINGKVSEKFDKNYPPLTDDQKKAMNQSDIDAWTTKAQTGLLNNDTLLSSIASSMRSSMYTDVKKLDDNSSSIGLILPDIGITTGLYTEQGKLNIDETKLRNALTSRPDDVIKLFTQQSSLSYSPYLTADQKIQRQNESGLFSKLSDIINSSISESYSQKGSLIQLAGNNADTYQTPNTYDDQITKMGTTITKLQTQLTDDQTRYYAQFTAMEKQLSQLNNQSNWIMQQMSSMNSGGN
jgi:flagellar hook-associated protein 2